MAKAEPQGLGSIVITNRQRFFIRCLLFVLVDLAVLNLFVEHWHYIVIDSFTISLFTACLLQILLRLTTNIERRIAAHFKDHSGKGALVKRFLATWVVLFLSKFVILEAVDLVFGDHVDFGGIIPFICVVSAMLLAELLLTRVFYRLAQVPTGLECQDRV
jgi:hypothetical protein